MIYECAELSGLPTVVLNSLRCNDIGTLEALSNCTKERLLGFNNIGAQAVNTIIQFLAAHGLALAGADGAGPLRMKQSVSLPFDVLQLVDACRSEESRSAFVARTLRDALAPAQPPAAVAAKDA